MDLSQIDPALIEARGKYASVNGAYKDCMEDMQKAAQKAYDLIRLALQDEVNRKHHATHLQKIIGILTGMAEEADELRIQKDELYPAAWGKES